LLRTYPTRKAASFSLRAIRRLRPRSKRGEVRGGARNRSKCQRCSRRFQMIRFSRLPLLSVVGAESELLPRLD
jgi:hypothetical protein